MKITDNTTKAVSLLSLDRGDVFLDPIDNEFFMKTDQNDGVGHDLKCTCVKLCNGTIVNIDATDSVLTVNAELIVS